MQKPITDTIASGVVMATDFRVNKMLGVKDYVDKKAISIIFTVLNDLISTKAKTLLIQTFVESLRDCGVIE